MRGLIYVTLPFACTKYILWNFWNLLYLKSQLFCIDYTFAMSMHRKISIEIPTCWDILLKGTLTYPYTIHAYQKTIIIISNRNLSWISRIISPLLLVWHLPNSIDRFLSSISKCKRSKLNFLRVLYYYHLKEFDCDVMWSWGERW